MVATSNNSNCSRPTLVILANRNLINHMLCPEYCLSCFKFPEITEGHRPCTPKSEYKKSVINPCVATKKIPLSATLDTKVNIRKLVLYGFGFITTGYCIVYI